VLGFAIVCAYGIIVSVLFTLLGDLHRKIVVQALYLCGLMVGFRLLAVGHQVPEAGGLAVFFSVLIYVAKGVIAILANGVPLVFIGSHWIGVLGRELSGLSGIVVRKTYDRAEGAEKRGDIETAISIYRGEIEKDPTDREARRRLAELLLKHSLPVDAMQQFKELLDSAPDGREWCRAAWRMAEVCQDKLDQPNRAKHILQAIIKEHPESEHARYARVRLGGAPAPPADGSAEAEPQPEDAHE
jgi:hypothetical protein